MNSLWLSVAEWLGSRKRTALFARLLLNSQKPSFKSMPTTLRASASDPLEMEEFFPEYPQRDDLSFWFEGPV